MKPRLLLIVCVLALTFIAYAKVTYFGPGETLPAAEYNLVRVIDGDTFTVAQDVLVESPATVIDPTMTGGASSGGAMSGGGDVGPLVELQTLERSVRVLGIDTPERGQPFREQANAYASLLLEPTPTLTLTPGPTPVDAYGRALASVTLASGDDFGLLMLSSGLAELRLEGDPAYGPLYTAARNGARSVGKGLYEGKPFKDYNCPDFRTQVEAQAFYDAAYSTDRPDPSKLDRNRDGLACK